MKSQQAPKPWTLHDSQLLPFLFLRFRISFRRPSCRPSVCVAVFGFLVLTGLFPVPTFQFPARRARRQHPILRSIWNKYRKVEEPALPIARAVGPYRCPVVVIDGPAVRLHHPAPSQAPSSSSSGSLRRNLQHSAERAWEGETGKPCAAILSEHGS